MIDTSAFIGRWPFRFLSQEPLAELRSHWQGGGVSEAWVSPLEAVFLPDPMPANAALSQDIAADPFFVFVAGINPLMASWRHDAGECVTRLCARAIKLWPNYHAYSLQDSPVGELCRWAAEQNRPVLIQLRMQDERGQPAVGQAPPVAVADVVRLAKQHPGTRFLACGAYRWDLPEIAKADNIWAELSFVESGDSISDACAGLNPKRLVFGSHTPLHGLLAVAAKVAHPPRNSTAADLTAIRTENARQLLG